MNPDLSARPKWPIDHRLQALLGAEVRIAAKAFCPAPRADRGPLRLVPVRELYLPDNTQAGGLPVFFEGRLRQFERQIGVVCVHLDAPTTAERATEGVVCFRGQAAILLRGPAVVELAFPFHVERLPDDPNNYWLDLRLPQAQFELTFPPQLA